MTKMMKNAWVSQSNVLLSRTRLHALPPQVCKVRSTTFRSGCLKRSLNSAPHQNNNKLGSPSACVSGSPSESGKQPKRALQANSLLWRCVDTATSLFPVWVALGATVAYFSPPSFLWFQPQYTVLVLALIMTGMGLTISLDDFAIAISNPGVVVLGVLAQYGIMPSLGALLGRVTGLSADLAVGLILVSVCPGGAASNLVCLIGKADVALSVVLTLCSTLVSIVMIPTLMKILAGSIVHISALPLLVSCAQVVLLPLVMGAILKRIAPKLVSGLSRIVPLLSVIGVTLICGSIVSRTPVGSLSPLLVGALAMLHGFGALLGFFLAKAFRLPKNSCRTVSIEVMMQNSGLAVALALAHFSSPVVAVPGAVSATMHSVMGSITAGVWRALDARSSTSTDRVV